MAVTFSSRCPAPRQQRKRVVGGTAVLAAVVCVGALCSGKFEAYTLPGEGAAQRFKEKLVPKQEIPMKLELLDEAMKKAGLDEEKIRADAQAWCEEEGAVDLTEVADDIEYLAQKIKLIPAQAEDLLEAIQAVMTEEREKRVQAEKEIRERMAVVANQVRTGQLSPKEATKLMEEAEEAAKELRR
eukprot:TRINITY_DN81468_c0_g1_i1.p1 TRINITY_DN81468_c0_g1~~TRINITY_DN81468_c0_g1_i1.p1  ORF type:complete len:185 (+),score=68.09 TRINITY_DN81468_c0_g1_i1:64-618(+)